MHPAAGAAASVQSSCPSAGPWPSLLLPVLRSSCTLHVHLCALPSSLSLCSCTLDIDASGQAVNARRGNEYSAVQYSTIDTIALECARNVYRVRLASPRLGFILCAHSLDLLAALLRRSTRRDATRRERILRGVILELVFVRWRQHHFGD